MRNLKFWPKAPVGEIALLLVRIEESQKCAKGVHLADLAKYLEFREEPARREMKGLTE